MPELPDIAAYITALEPRIVGQRIEHVRLASPFLLRTAQPPDNGCGGTHRAGVAANRQADRDWSGRRSLAGAALDDCRPACTGGLPGKAGWTQRVWQPSIFPLARSCLPKPAPGTAHRCRFSLARRPCVPWIREESTSSASDLSSFREALTVENRTLKRALTDPRIVSGIGNAYSDEILHSAQLSPVTLTHKLQPQEWERLFAATRDTLKLWIDRLRAEAEAGFPEKVTAFRKDMAVHGRYGEPCPRCGEKIQRIRYADNETNYCARCQTGGKLLADRSLSRLLKSDWPRTLEALESLKRR